MTQQLPFWSSQHELCLVRQQTAKKKQSRIRKCGHPSQASLPLISIFIFTLTSSYNQLFTQAQQQQTNNKFCGISYQEAYQFCHLPPIQSLPCPNGPTDCPHNLQCFTIREPCTQPPSISPTPYPTLSHRSKDPSDHYYCGIGFDNLYNCAHACPGGDSAECPKGQICYFDTPCDARKEGQTIITDNGDGGGEVVGGTVTTTGTSEGAKNFCGRTVTEAMETCSRDNHCPSGLNGECPEGMYCWSHLPDCNVNLMPSAKPTISPKPTDSPTLQPTTRSPSSTDSPTNAPLRAIDDHFYCGLSWVDAKNRCHMRCTEFYNNCPAGEECFNNVPCAGKLAPPAKPPSAPPTRAPFSGTLAPTISPKPTLQPVELPATPSPTHSPLPKDDMRNFFFCGNSWMDASRRCYKRCVSGHHIECPGDEQCFAQADCKRGLITDPPTPRPTVAPQPGTRSPTLSPAPSMFPSELGPTESPVPPNYEPTDGPTTPWPTFLPTFAPCKGDPCPNREHCRSKTGYCGAGAAYCKNPSWDASCGVPTDPPVSLPPTSPWPSINPSMSLEPSNPPPPTKTPSLSPSALLQNEPTEKPSDEAEAETGEEEFAADDPRGTFFCGTDWNHAITECPIRCPSGEMTECPPGWSCYAFTPCINVGNIQPPSLKPTWEPTRKPVYRPTRKPVTPEGETSEPTFSQQGWEQPPSPKPTFKPTGDRCRAVPCEDKSQCRSKLGFCGVGIIYCNSESSWEPNCDPDYGVNGGPSQAPSTLFDSWLNKQPGIIADDVSSAQNNVQEGKEDEVAEQAITEEVIYTNFNEGGSSGSQEQEGTGGLGSDTEEQEKEEEEIQVWWRVTSSASRASNVILLASLPIALLLW